MRQRSSTHTFAPATTAPVNRRSSRIIEVRFEPKPVKLNSTRVHDMGTTTLVEFQVAVPVSRCRNPWRIPGPLKLVLSHTERRLYGLKSHVPPVRLIPAPIVAVGREIVSRMEPVPSTLTPESTIGVLVAPKDPELDQPAPVSIVSNLVPLSRVLWRNSPVPRLSSATIVPAVLFAQVQLLVWLKFPFATRFAS